MRTNEAGDFSPYTLRLVNDAARPREDSFELPKRSPASIPQLAEVDFSFKVECGPDFDCAPQPPTARPICPRRRPSTISPRTTAPSAPILLDRMNQLLPYWGATSEADMGIVLAELIAYVGDHLSYQQDAVATEAYIETARSRISLRRHALLVDYSVHDGCNARAWIQLEVESRRSSSIARSPASTPSRPACPPPSPSAPATKKPRSTPA